VTIGQTRVCMSLAFSLLLRVWLLHRHSTEHILSLAIANLALVSGPHMASDPNRAPMYLNVCTSFNMSTSMNTLIGVA